MGFSLAMVFFKSLLSVGKSRSRIMLSTTITSHNRASVILIADAVKVVCEHVAESLSIADVLRKMNRRSACSFFSNSFSRTHGHTCRG